MPIELRPDHLEAVRGILAAHVPEFDVWAFGSRVTGTVKDYSDLDLAVITDSPLSARRLAILVDAFAESDLPFKVDVVDWAETDPNFRKIIAQNHESVRRSKTSRTPK